MTSKKNWTMRAAVLMLALVLITSCFVGGTFAKYVTSGSGADTARVAKFGVTVSVVNDSMFRKTYETNDENVTDAEIANSVVSDTEVIAPGTGENEMATVTLTGTPEVAVRVSYELSEFNLENWFTAKDEDADNAYCPLVFTVNGVDYYVGKGDAIADTAALISKVTEAVAAYSKEYPAGTNLAEKTGDNLVIGWRWNFVNDGTLAGSIQNDEKDTALGNRAAATDDTAATIEMTLKATVTQID